MVLSSSYGINASLKKKKQTLSNKNNPKVFKQTEQLRSLIIFLAWSVCQWYETDTRFHCWTTCYLNGNVIFFFLFLPAVGLKLRERGRDRSRGREKACDLLLSPNILFCMKMSWRFRKKGKFDLRFRNVQFNRLFHNFMDQTEKYN